MAGAPLKLLSRQLEKVLAELSEDPYALETTYINLIVFSGKVKKIVSNEEVYKVILPELHVGSGTNIGAALDFLYKDIHLNVEKTTLDKKGDWKPLIFSLLMVRQLTTTLTLYKTGKEISQSPLL